jgi:hypothetical protein
MDKLKLRPHDPSKLSNHFIVESVTAGSVASNHAIFPGDWIHSINGLSLSRKSFEEVQVLLKGDERGALELCTWSNPFRLKNSPVSEKREINWSWNQQLGGLLAGSVIGAVVILLFFRTKGFFSTLFCKTGPLTPEAIQKMSPNDIAERAAQRAGISSADCIKAVSELVSGKTFEKDWQEDALLKAFATSPYFQANSAHQKSIIDALVAMRAEAEAKAAAIKKMSPNDIAERAAQRAGISSADCIKAVGDLEFSGRTFKKDWQGSTLLKSFEGSSYFKDNQAHRDKVIEAMVAMRAEAVVE